MAAISSPACRALVYAVAANNTAPVETRVASLEQAIACLGPALEKLIEDMQAFKEEMRLFRESTQVVLGARRASPDWADRRWGQIVNKMGTLAADIVYPAIPAIFKTVFRQDREPSSSLRIYARHRHDRSRWRSFDAVAWGGVFLVVRTMSVLSSKGIDDFLEELAEARDYFVEAEGLSVVGGLAAHSAEPSLVLRGERRGLLMLGLSKGVVEVLNSPGFTPRGF